MGRKLKENSESLTSEILIPEIKKLSIEECRIILKANGAEDYTDEQIMQIRDVLYNLAKGI